MDVDKILSEYAQYNQLAKQAADEVERLKSEIKAYMISNHIDVLSSTEHTVKFSIGVQQRFSQKEFQKVFPDLYERFKIPGTRENWSFR